MVVSDEDVVRLEGCPPYPASFLWMVDITDEKHPHAGSDLPDRRHARRAAALHDRLPPAGGAIVTGTEIPVAWFAQGLRIIDISRPHALKEVAYFMPDVPPGSQRVQSNDVTVDERGLIYLLDRVRGLHILERVG